MMEVDQPSILVAAAMSSVTAVNQQWRVMTKSYQQSSHTDIMAPDSNTSECIEAAHDNTKTLADAHLPANDHIDLIDSDDEKEGGALTDDGYVPDAEATEEDKPNPNKTKTIDSGYIPDAEITEEETVRPRQIGAKSVKKRDVRFEAVVETRETPPMLPLPVAAAIDEGYIPDGALTEEEKRDRQERRNRSIEIGYLPDATDDDTAEKSERRASHQKAPPIEMDDPIDPGELDHDCLLQKYTFSLLISAPYPCRVFAIGR
jgi:hypothetical protein